MVTHPNPPQYEPRQSLPVRFSRRRRLTSASILFLLAAGWLSAYHFYFSPRKLAKPNNGPLSSSLHSNNRTDAVQWDGYSIWVHGHRIFLWSGEFHPWRLPVVDLWPDILDKMKGAGMNAVSIYVHWGLTNPSPGVFDFDDYRGLETFFKMAMQAGLWVVLRPGPYINAETTAGGIPHWVTSAVTSHLRTNETSYRDTWEPYMKRIAEISRDYQVTAGGPIIGVQLENEFVERDTKIYKGRSEMMQQLKELLIDNGIVVPLTVNDAYMGKNFVKGLGSGDIYGFDSYPQSFDCANPSIWKELVTEYHSFHQEANPDQPLYIPEFQGGAFDAWGPNAPGYDACKKLTGPEFESVFNLNLWANNAKMVNIYMVYGGTSWGHLPFPGVYTSYDYGAAISENRDISNSKYAELKRQGLFLRSTPDFYKTDVVGNSTHPRPSGHGLSSAPRAGTVASGKNTPAVEIDNPNVFVTFLENPDTLAGFYVARQLNSTSEEHEFFRLNVTLRDPNAKDSATIVSIPQFASSIQLSGRQSKVVLTNLKFGGIQFSASHHRPEDRFHGPPPPPWSPQHLIPDFMMHRCFSAIRSLFLHLTTTNTQPSTLLYSTASLLYSGRFGRRDVLVLYGDSDQEHELAFIPRGTEVGSLVGSDKFQTRHHQASLQDSLGGSHLRPTVVNILPGFTGLLPVWESTEQLVLFANTQTAGEVWLPDLQDAVDEPLDSRPPPHLDIKEEFKHFWSIGTNSSVLVSGPKFVRSATYSRRAQALDLTGDISVDDETYLTVIGAPHGVRTISWNGMPIESMLAGEAAVADSPSEGILQFVVRPKVLEQESSQDSDLQLESQFTPPTLSDWLYTDSLPEIKAGFDDSGWVTADHDKTNMPYKPKYGEKVLYGCDYGFCEGIVLWRGHFNATGDENSVRLSINGGEAFAASVFINDVFLNTTFGNSTNNKNIVAETDEVYHFPRAALKVGQDNVVTVVQDNMGLDETLHGWDTDGSRSPRGIRGYSLNGGVGKFTHWKVQGKRGGYTEYPDKLRGIFNEGGLFGERQGWHLPHSEWERRVQNLARESESLGDGSWTQRDPWQGLPSQARFAVPAPGAPYSFDIQEAGTSGVGFFKTTFSMTIPKGYDGMFSFEFTDLGAGEGASSSLPPYRALLFVNGWMMGKRVGNLGPQTKFPVHEGIINLRGINTLVLALWSMSPTAPIRPHLKLVMDAVYQGGVPVTLAWDRQ